MLKNSTALTRIAAIDHYSQLIPVEFLHYETCRCNKRVKIKPWQEAEKEKETSNGEWDKLIERYGGEEIQ